MIGIWKFLLYLQRMNKYQYTVTVYTSGESCTIHALLDTGNSLCDPVTGKPVCILGKRQAGEILKEKELQTLRYIPYCSVGTEKGTSGNQSRKNVHSYRAGVLGGKAAHSEFVRKIVLQMGNIR